MQHSKKHLEHMPLENLITLFEQQTVSYEALGLAADDPVLEVLDRLNHNSDMEMVQLERKGLRASRYVGVIQAGSRTFQILPKIDCDLKANAEAAPGSDAFQLAAAAGRTTSLATVISYPLRE